MTRALLDINVLLALIDSNHSDHDRAHEWWGGHAAGGWATCAITENGFVRVISQPRYPHAVPAAEAISLLRGAQEAGDHEFWSCDLSLLDRSVVVPGSLLGPKQVTDVYLLALAVSHDTTLVTLDHRVSLGPVIGAESRHLTTL